jgi:hypothetical protein
MNHAIKSKLAALALGVAIVGLTGSITLAASAPDTRDHRTKPVVRDQQGGTQTQTTDHRTGGASGGVTVTESKRRPRGTQCLGNLCGVKVCTASVCF